MIGVAFKKSANDQSCRFDKGVAMQSLGGVF
jgi:hypothetical protein